MSHSNNINKISRNKRKRQPIGMLGRSSGNHDWLLANARACVSCGFRLRNARNDSDCVWMETGLNLGKWPSRSPLRRVPLPTGWSRPEMNTIISMTSEALCQSSSLLNSTYLISTVVPSGDITTDQLYVAVFNRLTVTELQINNLKIINPGRLKVFFHTNSSR